MRYFLVLVLFSCVFTSYAQIDIKSTTPWRFMKGDSTSGYRYPVYGQQGVAAEGNNPGGRTQSVTWKDANGNLWLFGGLGESSVDEGLLNDLWKFDIAINQWIFIKGDNISNVPGVYGIRSVASADNKPGARRGSASWIDDAGNLWLYGGFGYYTGGSGYLNDLWKYDVIAKQWTWINGDNSKDVPQMIGVTGTAGVDNNPGGRSGSACWKDNSGRFWLFGGGKGTSMYNDVWMYDPSGNQWTCKRPSPLPCGVFSRYGILGVSAPENTPGCRSNVASWKDANGNFWVFGGTGPGGNFNDMWKYSPATNQWAWMKGDSTEEKPGIYGSRGVSSANNNPGSRGKSTFWTDATGKFWLYGGHVSVGFHVYSYMNDLWCFSTSTNEWVWVAGDNTPVHYGVYGNRGIAAPGNKPGSRSNGSAWTDNSGRLWMLGGFTDHPNQANTSAVTGNYNDLWKYNISSGEWTWQKGDSILNLKGAYGEAGFPFSGNKPATRMGSVSWKDASGNLWLFGGDGEIGITFNDVWKYDIASNQWIWMKGSNSILGNDPGVYGTKGIADPANNPPARFNSISWTDAAGKFWLFGGSGLSNDYYPGIDDQYSDLWMFDPSTTNWTWVAGDNIINKNGVYGTKGIEAAANFPGGRHDAISWTDAYGNLWMFGGEGFAANGSRGLLNDLWKFNVTTKLWTWINGDDVTNSYGNYGSVGIAAASNKPGARSESVSFIDPSGNFWLFGGTGFSTSGSQNASYFMSDLWKYNPNTNLWTWVKGSNYAFQPGVYGAAGVSATTNLPGCRQNAVAASDASGNFYLFGGYGSTSNNTGFLNDLWKYNVSSNQWVWLKGDSIVNSGGNHTVKGEASPTINPSSKEGAVSWMDNAGNFWVYGGTSSFRFNGNMEDLFKYSPSLNQWTWVNGRTSFSSENVYGIQGLFGRNNVPGARNAAAEWTDSTGTLWLFGGANQQILGITYHNDLWKYDQTINQWAFVKGDTVTNNSGLYGTKGIGNIFTKPAARSGAASWIDKAGNFWLFGGKNHNYVAMNDLWRYSPVTNIWTWVKGDSAGSYERGGVYGNLGVATDANNPGWRQQPAYWTDTTGNFWLYGGSLYVGCGAYNDLWKYNPSTNQWIWVSGDSILTGNAVYGTKGVPAASNTPGTRTSANTWTDNNGKLWMFGGRNHQCGIGSLSDLWKYDPITNLWVWVHGASTPNSYGYYDVAGSPGPNNEPGSRNEGNTWKDLLGNFWLFGGNGGTGFLDDLWKYNISTNQWTYIKGLNSGFSAGDYPGGRASGSSWSDKYGNFWLFGGVGFGTSGNGFLNDLWKVYTGFRYFFVGDGIWSDPANWLNNIVPPTTITPGLDVTIDHILPGQCVSQGPVTVQSFGILRVESGKKLTIDQAGLVNTGNIIGPGNRPGTISFTGQTTDELRSPGEISTPIVLTNNKQMFLTGNSGTSRVELSGGSKLSLGNFNLDMDTAALVADNSSYIVTNGPGRLIRSVAANPVTFNIGSNSTSYTPVTLVNTGVPGDFKVKVLSGIPDAFGTENVNNLWSIDSTSSGSNLTITMQWNATDEQPAFARGNAYISQSHACPEPPNCVDEYFDVTARTNAFGTGPFTLTRTNITNPTKFLIRSGMDVSTFTGNGSWNDPNNWTIGLTPSQTIGNGKHIIIDPPGNGQCTVTGDIIIQPGGKLTVKSNKSLNVSGKIILQ